MVAIESDRYSFGQTYASSDFNNLYNAMNCIGQTVMPLQDKKLSYGGDSARCGWC